jgi:hypothetical protein
MAAVRRATAGAQMSARKVMRIAVRRPSRPPTSHRSSAASAQQIVTISTASSRCGRIASSRALRSRTYATPCPVRDSIRSPCIFLGTFRPSVCSTVAEMSGAAM